LTSAFASQVIAPSAHDDPCLCSEAIVLKLKKGDPMVGGNGDVDSDYEMISDVTGQPMRRLFDLDGA
jgi:hypothetical protein